MLQDLAAITPPLVVCVAFLVGVGWLLRREMAPRRRTRRNAAAKPGDGSASEARGPRERP